MSFPQQWKRVANQMSFPQQWRPMRFVLRERREETDELWRRLDDLVTDSSNCPSPCGPCNLLTSIPRPRPCSGRCALDRIAEVFYCDRGSRAVPRILSTDGRVVRLC